MRRVTVVEVPMPRGKLSFCSADEILGVGLMFDEIQGYRPILWVLRDPEHGLFQPYYFRVVGNDEDIPDRADIRYIGTAREGHLVFHVFEEKVRR